MAFTSEMRDKAAQTRRMNAEARRAEKAPTSTGVGESRVFCDPNAPQEDDALLDCHINGKRIRDLGFTPLQLSAISYHITDEGIAARNEGKQDARASVTTDPLQKRMQKRREDIHDRGMETWQAEDPMREAVQRHVPAGMRPHFLADSVVKHRGMRGWQPVIVDGQPVTVGTLKLGVMPEEKAEVRNTHYRKQGRQQLDQVQQKYLESGDKSAVSDQ